MYESDVENSHIENIRQLSALIYKFRAIGKKGAPDRLILYPIQNKKHEKIINKYIQFIEFKAPGRKPNHHQKIFHEELRSRGYKVQIIDRKIKNEK